MGLVNQIATRWFYWWGHPRAARNLCTCLVEAWASEMSASALKRLIECTRSDRVVYGRAAAVHELERTLCLAAPAQGWRVLSLMDRTAEVQNWSKMPQVQNGSKMTKYRMDRNTQLQNGGKMIKCRMDRHA